MPRPKRDQSQVMRVEFKIRRELVEVIDRIARDKYTTRQEAITSALVGYYKDVERRYAELLTQALYNGKSLFQAIDAASAGEEPKR